LKDELKTSEMERILAIVIALILSVTASADVLEITALRERWATISP